MKSKTNPFKYGKVVSDPYFIDREEELQEIRSTIEGGNNLILYAPRRYGKTSLVMKVLTELKSNNTVYLDFFSITSIETFIDSYLNKILQTQKSSIQVITKKISKYLRGITPSITFDQLGKPTWSFQFNPASDKEMTLNAVLELPQKLVKEGQRFYIVFDEFQEINKLNCTGFEKQLRSAIQHQKSVSYVFLGSKTHLLMQLFNSKERALYHSGRLFSLGKIAKVKIHEYIRRQFVNAGHILCPEIIDKLIAEANNIPYYNQYLASQLWQQMQEAPDGKHDDLLKKAIDNILDNQNEYYISIYEHITLYQRTVIKALMQENQQVFSQDYHNRHNLTTPSSTKRAIDSLIDQGILERIDDAYFFTDPFFPHWLRLCNYA